MRRLFRNFAAFFLIGAALAAPPVTEPKLEGIDAFINDQIKEWKVPGLAIAVVKDGRVIHSSGYGFRSVEQNIAVTPKTLFAIGSVTKSFTATLLAMLVADGKLEWDKPVREYLPDFRLHDIVATERATVRDLLTHRTGLQRHDLIWYGSILSRRQMYERLRYLEPAKDFRSIWQYNNLMYMTAGYLAGKLANTSWEELAKERLLGPLEMKASNFSVSESQKSDDYALPYQEIKGEVRQVPFRVLDEIGPAGSINSNVEDMARYLIFHLARGKHGDKQLLAESYFRELHSPQMVVPGPGRWKELGTNTYALGWMVTSYRGRRVVQHGGGIDGFASLATLLPDDNTGIIVLTNKGGSPVTSNVTWQVIDRLTDQTPVDWAARSREDRKRAEAAEAEREKKTGTDRKEGTKPSHEVADYAGEYEHPAYGIAKVTKNGEGLRLKYNSFEFPLKHYHYDVFELVSEPGGMPLPISGLKTTFSLNSRGDVEKLMLPVDPGNKEIVFTRLPDAAAASEELLSSLTGEYQFGPQTATVALRADKTLTLTVPGQPVYEMVPVRPLVFNLKGLSGFSIEFKRDSEGRVTELISHQPNGSFPGKRK